MSTPPRVLFLSAAGLPHAVGGRDVFMHELARALRMRGVPVLCAYHQTPMHEPVGRYMHDGVDYAVLPAAEGERDRRHYFGRTAAAIPGFAELLAGFRPDVLHLHDFGVSCGLPHLREAAGRGIRTVMTFHSPGQSCPQKALRYRGRTPCDGELVYGRCSQCRLSVQGVPIAAAAALARLPLRVLGIGYTSAPMRLLTSPNATKTEIDAWFEMVRLIDLMHTHAKWVHDMVALNNVPAAKLCLHRTGLPRPAVRVTPEADPAGRLRVAFLGRCDPVKGIEVLVAAVKRLSADAPISVSFFGPYWSDAFGQSLLKIIAGDGRFEPPVLVPPTELHRVWSRTDVLAVPSLWPETGPLVALEAFAAGIPVVGSDLGGIPELVRDGVDGLLFPVGDAAALSTQLARLLAEPGLLARLRANVRPPRTLADLADDLLPEYCRMVAQWEITGGGDGMSLADPVAAS